MKILKKLGTYSFILGALVWAYGFYAGINGFDSVALQRFVHYVNMLKKNNNIPFNGILSLIRF